MSVNHSFFLLAPFPERCSCRGYTIQANPLINCNVLLRPKRLKFQCRFGVEWICHGLQSLFTGWHAFLGDMMSQIVNLALKEITLCQLELQLVLSEVFKHSLPMQFCINLNVARALHSPNSMCMHSKRPKFSTVKALYCFEASSIAICQTPAFKSSRRNILHQPTLNGFLYSWKQIGVLHLICGSWCKNCRCLSCTLTLKHRIWLGQIVPASNISFQCA